MLPCRPSLGLFGGAQITALDDAINNLQLLLLQQQDADATDIGNLWQLIGAANLDSWESGDRQAIIAALLLYLPDLVIGSAALAADFTTTWYDDLAPDDGSPPRCQVILS